MKFKAVDRIVLPRRISVCDWGSERICLIRMGNKQLWWWKAHQAWAGLGNREQRGGELLLVELKQGVDDGYPERQKTVFEGGRLSSQRFRQTGVAAAIDGWFGCQVTVAVEDLYRKKTLVAHDNGDIVCKAVCTSVAVDSEGPPVEPATSPDQVWERLRAGLYENKVKHVDFHKDQAANRAYHDARRACEARFREDLIIGFGLAGHPLADKVYSLAYEFGHGLGFHDVVSTFDDLARLVKPIEVTITQDAKTGIREAKSPGCVRAGGGFSAEKAVGDLVLANPKLFNIKLR